MRVAFFGAAFFGTFLASAFFRLTFAVLDTAFFGAAFFGLAVFLVGLTFAVSFFLDFAIAFFSAVATGGAIWSRSPKHEVNVVYRLPTDSVVDLA